MEIMNKYKCIIVRRANRGGWHLVATSNLVHIKCVLLRLMFLHARVLVRPLTIRALLLTSISEWGAMRFLVTWQTCRWKSWRTGRSRPWWPSTRISRSTKVNLQPQIRLRGRNRGGQDFGVGSRLENPLLDCDYRVRSAVGKQRYLLGFEGARRVQHRDLRFSRHSDDVIKSTLIYSMNLLMTW